MAKRASNKVRPPARPTPARKARTGSGAKTTTGKGRPPSPSSRYTPPIPKEQRVSPRWVPVTMFLFLLAGVAVIILNYVSLLPGAPTNLYLVLGLALILVGFIISTRLH